MGERGGRARYVLTLLPGGLANFFAASVDIVTLFAAAVMSRSMQQGRGSWLHRPDREEESLYKKLPRSLSGGAPREAAWPMGSLVPSAFPPGYRPTPWAGYFRLTRVQGALPGWTGYFPHTRGTVYDDSTKNTHN